MSGYCICKIKLFGNNLKINKNSNKLLKIPVSRRKTLYRLAKLFTGFISGIYPTAEHCIVQCEFSIANNFGRFY